MSSTREIAEQAYAAMQAGDIGKLTQLCAANCVLDDIGITLRGRFGCDLPSSSPALGVPLAVRHRVDLR